jgi:hypothetical protein
MPRRQPAIPASSRSSHYQIWLMNNWLVDLNTTLAASSDDFVRSLWRKTCATGIPANVILMDNIYLQPGTMLIRRAAGYAERG